MNYKTALRLHFITVAQEPDFFLLQAFSQFFECVKSLQQNLTDRS